ncbi:hypothetical protein E2C01_002163 [Portunus trituberculatus]|uniref:Uncharacterized protein n=1 Tax=Portunus trituberculatus TaxID=210409 RepID=A0A5B7CJ61_PORTR|nr:hypothetical protein [Portunus trituberculatus]
MFDELLVLVQLRIFLRGVEMFVVFNWHDGRAADTWMSGEALYYNPDTSSKDNRKYKNTCQERRKHVLSTSTCSSDGRLLLDHLQPDALHMLMTQALFGGAASLLLPFQGAQFADVTASLRLADVAS